MNSALQKEK
jgi:hypothetical protein